MRHVSKEALFALQSHFHDVIRDRASPLIDEHQIELPELAPLLSAEEGSKEYFPIPGMYGGFSYWLEGEGEQTRLVTESWSRIVGGSGMRHVVTTEGSELVETGFV